MHSSTRSDRQSATALEWRKEVRDKGHMSKACGVTASAHARHSTSQNQQHTCPYMPTDPNHQHSSQMWTQEAYDCFVDQKIDESIVSGSSRETVTSANGNQFYIWKVQGGRLQAQAASACYHFCTSEKVASDEMKAVKEAYKLSLSHK